MRDGDDVHAGVGLLRDSAMRVHRSGAFGLLAAGLLGCGARTDLGGARHVDASTDAAGDAGVCMPVLSDAGCAPSSCMSGTCTSTLVAEPVNDLVVDATSIYWTTNNALMKASLCGANAVSLAVCVQPTLLAIDADDVYFVEQAAHEQQVTSTVSRIPKAGGSAVKLATFDNEQVLALALNGTELFLSLSTYASIQGRLVRLPIATGIPQTLFTGEMEMGLAVDDDYVFWGSMPNLMRAAHDGTGQLKLADAFLAIVSDSGVSAIALDAEYTYWTGGCGAVARVPRDATTQTHRRSSGASRRTAPFARQTVRAAT